ncbi:hypothetical protein [Negadavirga shengliensis]|uniref:Uncharacterized protein n=1 Tax=Negadavirga shengliensis TaxID=1389218 RepID=A0ABV9T0I1_9BACT
MGNYFSLFAKFQSDFHLMIFVPFLLQIKKGKQNLSAGGGNPFAVSYLSKIKAGTRAGKLLGVQHVTPQDGDFVTNIKVFKPNCFQFENFLISFIVKQITGFEKYHLSYKRGSVLSETP